MTKSFIKKRSFKLSEIENKIISKIGDYYFFNIDGEVLLGGINLIKLSELHPILFTYQLKFLNKLSKKEKEYFENYFNQDLVKNNEIYTVGLITLNSLRNFKYSENLNILSLYFINKEEAFIMQDILERFRYANFKTTTENSG